MDLVVSHFQLLSKIVEQVHHFALLVALVDVPQAMTTLHLVPMVGPPLVEPPLVGPPLVGPPLVGPPLVPMVGLQLASLVELPIVMMVLIVV
jgi:hypothetical protein